MKLKELCVVDENQRIYQDNNSKLWIRLCQDKVIVWYPAIYGTPLIDQQKAELENAYEGII